MDLSWTPEERRFREMKHDFVNEKLLQDIRAKVLKRHSTDAWTMQQESTAPKRSATVKGVA